MTDINTIDIDEEVKKLREIAKGYQAQYDLLSEKFEEVKRDKDKYDALYTAYNLFSDALETPRKGILGELNGYMKANKGNIPEEDTARLRIIFMKMKQAFEIVLKSELGATNL